MYKSGWSGFHCCFCGFCFCFFCGCCCCICCYTCPLFISTMFVFCGVSHDSTGGVFRRGEIISFRTSPTSRLSPDDPWSVSLPILLTHPRYLSAATRIKRITSSNSYDIPYYDVPGSRLLVPALVVFGAPQSIELRFFAHGEIFQTYMHNVCSD